MYPSHAEPVHKIDGANLYVWLVSPDLAPCPVPQDLSWRTEPTQGDFLGEVGVARRTWDGRLSTQIDLAVQNALFGLAKIRGVDYVDINGQRNLCVLVALNPNATKDLFDSIIQQSRRSLKPTSEEALYEEFRASKAQQELLEATSQ